MRYPRINKNEFSDKTVIIKIEEIPSGFDYDEEISCGFSSHNNEPVKQYTFIYNGRIVRHDIDETIDEEMFSYRYFFFDIWETEASYIGLSDKKPILVTKIDNPFKFKYKVID